MQIQTSDRYLKFKIKYFAVLIQFHQPVGSLINTDFCDKIQKCVSQKAPEPLFDRFL